MSPLVDAVAKEIAIRRWALPECLHVPIGAVDEAAIVAYVGAIERVLASGNPTRALLVRAAPRPAIDERLPIGDLPASQVLHAPLQVWVHVDYTGYRRAYRSAFPSEPIDDKVISHSANRRMAGLEAFSYVRLTPVSRGANSSSGFSEQWGVKLHSEALQRGASLRRGAHIRYADLSEIMLMMDLKLGGGIMAAVNEGQKLVRSRT